jgi:hypothetical protein
MHLKALLVNIIFLSVVCVGMETDQFNLPPEPLADIGPEITIYVHERIGVAAKQINAEILKHQSCIDSKCADSKRANERIVYLRSEKGLADYIYKQLGARHFIRPRIEGWITTYKFKSQPALYKAPYRDSIYFKWPLAYLTISPTIKTYDVYLGTDKFSHLFQQGYQYYKIFNKAIKRGADHKEATMRAVRFGQKTERGIYGTFIIGVFSNADLAANYAGMKFYQGLTHDLVINNRPRKSLLILRNGLWKHNESLNIQEELLKPFISNHFNEAVNPSIYTTVFGLRNFVKQALKKRYCKNQLENQEKLMDLLTVNPTRELSNWYGEDYGFTGQGIDLVQIKNTCLK